MKKLKRRPFPYLKVAKLWAKGKTIESIARSVDRYQKDADDPLHSFRVSLTRMHAGYKDSKGHTVKLPHRISRAAIKAATKAGALSQKPKPKPRKKPVRKPVAKKPTPKVKVTKPVVTPSPKEPKIQKPEAAA